MMREVLLLVLWGLVNIGSPAEAVIYGAELARRSRGGSLDAETTQSREQTAVEQSETLLMTVEDYILPGLEQNE